MAEFAEIRMPEEQEGTKSVVRAWLREIGQPVKRDDPLVEIETDKVAVEVPAPVNVTFMMPFVVNRIGAKISNARYGLSTGTSSRLCVTVSKSASASNTLSVISLPSGPTNGATVRPRCSSASA